MDNLEKEIGNEALFLCFLLFLILILGAKLLSSSTPTETDQSSVVPTTLFEKVYNPYTLRMVDSKEQFSLSITSDHHSKMYIAWGVLISEIFPLIHLSSHTLSDSVYLSDELSKISLQLKEHTIVNEEETIFLQKPHNDLGPVPRDRYPLVVFITASSLSGAASMDCNKIMGLVSFIHIKDSTCTAKTHIFDQYVKTADGRLHNIKPIYVSSNETNDNEPNVESRTCSLCMCGIINKVLLPCRHACMCDDCLPKLINCPVCRCAIVSTFNI